jgi:hypothetical protein
LFLFLWLNRAYGVDTKLHLFDPTQTVLKPPTFFEAADYVVCQEPTRPVTEERDTLFVAIPGDEEQCLQITNRPHLCTLFRFEFFSRLSGGHDIDNKSHMMFDVVRFKIKAIREILCLSSIPTERLWAVLEEAMNAQVAESATRDLWSESCTKRLEARWREWFPATNHEAKHN